MTHADNGQKAIRSFIALEVEEPMRSQIVGVICDLRPRMHDVRWVSEAQIHLTLRFLGEASPVALERLTASLKGAVAVCPPAEAHFAGLGVFPPRGSPRVLWLGVSLPPACFKLQSDCESAAVAAGLHPEERPFHPHLTLGRWRARSLRPVLPELDLGCALLSRLVLFRSDLRPGGAIYTPLSIFVLGSHTD